MTIRQMQNKERLTIALEGRLDSIAAKQLEETVALEGVTELELDLTLLSYISSAGLRVVLNAQKQMNAKNGTMAVRNVNGLNMEIFESVGFTDFLTIVNE